MGDEIAAALKRTYEDLERRFGSPGGVTGLPSGFACLDRHTRGFCGGEFVVLASAPSLGKSSLATQMALTCSTTAPLLVFSFQIPGDHWAEQAMAHEARVPPLALRSGQLQRDHITELTYAANALSKRRILVVDDSGMSIADVDEAARGWLAEQTNEEGIGSPHTGLILVDDIQALATRTGDREAELAAISSGLKALARTTGCVVLGVSQLSRRALQAPGDPQLTWLRGSGALENDADAILFLSGDQAYEERALLLMKHRAVRRSGWTLAFDAGQRRFGEVAPPTE